MKRSIALLAATAFVITGCTDNGESGGSVDSNDDDASSEAVIEESVEHLEVLDPFDLGLTAPDGFVQDTDTERPTLVSEDHQTYVYGLIDGHESVKLMVSTYVLPEDTDTSDYDSQVEVILAFDDEAGNATTASNHYPSVVNGYEGIFRFGDFDSVRQHNHYLFADQHLIQITCEWEFSFNALNTGCQSLLQNFPYPEEWPV